jgi:hypothetical protein
MLDTAAEVNVVNQRFALSKGFQQVEAELPHFSWLTQDSSAYCYGAYKIPLRMRDAWGQTRENTLLFYAMADVSHDMILGMPGLKETRITLDCAEKAWRWGIEIDALQVQTPKRFARSLKGEARVYAVVIKAPAFYDSSAGVAQLPEELQEYKDVFSEEGAGELAEHRWADHAIEIEPDKEVPFGPLYNLSPKELAVLRDYLDAALEKGWIRRSTSPAGAPILFVPKKDGKLRLCVDYRGLNKVTIKNRLALPLISETLDRLTGANWFTKLDLRDAYHRLRIKRGDEWKTAFRTRYGHFEYLVMPFGLTNAPATFQGYINRALAGLLDITCVVYLDDILIFSETLPELWRRTGEVLTRLREYKLYAKMEKCEFAVREVEFLGYIVTPQGVKMDPRRVAAIEE